MKEVGLGLIGCGVVGGGVVRFLHENKALIEERLGARLALRKVAALNPPRAEHVPPGIVTRDWQDVVRDDTVDIVIELMGGTSTASEVAMAAIEAGKPLITANKALLAEKGEPIFRKAEEKDVSIYFEASIGGGIPIVKALHEGLNANRILSIHGIINGTCNYILTRMVDEGLEFEPVLKEAKELGYAEADESLDVDGVDAAHKAALLASIAYGFWVPMDKVMVEGIRGITAADIHFARKLGYRIILLATIKPARDRAVEVRVHPTLIPESHILASVTGVFNAISVVGDAVGETLFYGRGAGAEPTASAVISDIIEAGYELIHQAPSRKLRRHTLHGEVLPADEIRTPYYLRLLVANRPGVLARIAQSLGSRDIGISSLFQPKDGNQGEDIPLVMLLDEAREADLRAAVKEIEALDVVRDRCQVLRVEDFS